MRITTTNQASMQKDATSLKKEMIKGQLQQRHEKAMQTRELMADGLKTVLNSRIKPTKGD